MVVVKRKNKNQRFTEAHKVLLVNYLALKVVYWELTYYISTRQEKRKRLIKGKTERERKIRERKEKEKKKKERRKEASKLLVLFPVLIELMGSRVLGALPRFGWGWNLFTDRFTPTQKMGLSSCKLVTMHSLFFQTCSFYSFRYVLSGNGSEGLWRSWVVPPYYWRSQCPLLRLIPVLALYCVVLSSRN